MEIAASIKLDIVKESPTDHTDCEICGSEMFLTCFNYYVILEGIRMNDPLFAICEDCHEINNNGE